MPWTSRACLALAACLALLGAACGQEAARGNQWTTGTQRVGETQVCEDVTKLGPGDDACAYVREHCESESLIDYAQLYYCHVAHHGWLPTALMVALCTAVLVALFRAIGRASDDFFSCILSQISQDLGLPPRLGGVTLLALGNGAPDLSSCIAAVKSGNYRMALGALTGAGIFVGGVVAGRIVTLNGGVRARGAQIRDISSQFIAVAVVTCIVASGWFTYGSVATLLCLYSGYVVVVAVADFSHRAGVEWGEVAKRVHRRMSGRWKRDLHVPLLAHDYGNGNGHGGAAGRQRQLVPAHPPPVPEEDQLSDVSGGGSSDEPEMAAGALPPGTTDQQQQQRPDLQGGVLPPAASLPVPLGSPQRSSSPALQQPADAGFRSMPDLQAGRRLQEQQQWQQRLPRAAPPVAAFQPHLTYDALIHMPAAEYRKRALADLAQSKSFYRRRTTDTDGEDDEDADGESYLSEEEMDEWEEGMAPQHAWQDEELGSVGGCAGGPSGYQPPVVSFNAAALAQHAAAEEGGAAAGAAAGGLGGLAGRRMEHQGSGNSRGTAASGASTTQFSIGSMEMMAAGGGPASAGAVGAGGGGGTGRAVRFEAAEEERPPTQLALALEAAQRPLIVMLQATIPLVEVNSYQRDWFMRSMAASPLFIVAYLQLFSWQALLIALAFGAVLAGVAHLGTLRLDGKAPLWTLGTSYPIGAALLAVYGFALAAMWISLFACEIVGLLQFFGMLSKVDPAVLGVTVLAWGNSLMDLLNNTAMAGKSRGGNSMAMTACFAGPLFNMLVGLGLGFWALLGDSHASRAKVEMDPVVLVGCIFILVNCASLVAISLLHRQWLPAWSGRAMVGCYCAYLATVLAVLLLDTAD